MSSDSSILHAARELVGVLNKTVDENLPEEIAEIVKFHSAGAAAAGVAAGWVPGFGGLAATGISAGFIWTMYSRINSKIGIPLSDNVIKSIGSGIATNIAAYFVGGIVLSTLFSVIPGIGSVGASVLVGGTCYSLTLASGFVYLKMLTHLFESGQDPVGMDGGSLKKTAVRVMGDLNIKDIVEQAKSEYNKVSDKQKKN